MTKGDLTEIWAALTDPQTLQILKEVGLSEGDLQEMLEDIKNLMEGKEESS